MKSLIRAVSIGSKALLEFSTCERTGISFPVQLQVMSSWAGPHMQKERHMHFTESQKMTKQLLLNNKYHICNRLPFLSFPPELQDQVLLLAAIHGFGAGVHERLCGEAAVWHEGSAQNQTPV